MVRENIFTFFFPITNFNVDDLKYKEHDFLSFVQNTLVISNAINTILVLDILDSIGSQTRYWRTDLHQYCNTLRLSVGPSNNTMDESISISPKVGLVSSSCNPTISHPKLYLQKHMSSLNYSKM